MTVVLRGGGETGRKLIAHSPHMNTGNANVLCLLQLPDDVKQNIEDAGARYIPYALRLFKTAEQAY